MSAFEAQNPSFPEINRILALLIPGVQEILGEEFIGIYLDGSLTSGDFDEDSDIDFVVVTRSEISEDTFTALQLMHDKISAFDSIWSIQLEGSYISLHAVRRYDPAYTLYPNIERGRGERLKWAHHDETWNIHRYVLRERGIKLLGPDPQTLIDPVSPAQLRQAMVPQLSGWAEKILKRPEQINRRGYQSYCVLTICRILYTLENGAVASKPAGKRWAQENLDQRWFELIERAWEGRHFPDSDAGPEEIRLTLDFLRFALERVR